MPKFEIYYLKYTLYVCYIYNTYTLCVHFFLRVSGVTSAVKLDSHTYNAYSMCIPCYEPYELRSAYTGYFDMFLQANTSFDLFCQINIDKYYIQSHWMNNR